jgi:hypothetical protein
MRESRVKNRFIILPDITVFLHLLYLTILNPKGHYLFFLFLVFNFLIRRAAKAPERLSILG